jgi:hypothetical protein
MVRIGVGGGSRRSGEGDDKTIVSQGGSASPDWSCVYVRFIGADC